MAYTSSAAGMIELHEIGPARYERRGHGPRRGTSMSSTDPNVPHGYCQCGCGQQTRIAHRDYEEIGWKKGEPIRFVSGHQSRLAGLPYAVDTDTGCWIWQRTINRDGYAMIRRGDYRGSAHIYFYVQANGPVPVGLQLDHLCRNRACVNPDHLEPVTQAENVRRGKNAKLTLEQVRRIRESSLSGRALAAFYGVCPAQISKIRLGKAWRDAT